MLYTRTDRQTDGRACREAYEGKDKGTHQVADEAGGFSLGEFQLGHDVNTAVEQIRQSETNNHATRTRSV